MEGIEEGMKETLIMEPFNALFISIFAALILVLILVSLFLRKRSIETRKKVLVIASLLTLVGFVVYKYFLSIDAEFDAIRTSIGMGGFNWWGELPLHLCNINMILIPIAVLKDKRELLAFCFFVGPLGAMMALAMPGVEFSGVSILLPRMLGFYGTHFLIVIECLAIVTFGLYRPSFKDMPRTILTIILIALSVFAFNMILRLTGIFPKANYFYSVETEGNVALELFHSWIPFPFLYLLPSIPILAVYISIVTTGFAIADKRKGKEPEQN